MSYTFVEGGVCAAKGFSAGAVHAGIRKNRTKNDLALIVSDKPCAAAAIYTQNKVKGAPILVTPSALQVLALPELQRNAFAWPSFRCACVTRMGAPLTLFCV